MSAGRKANGVFIIGLLILLFGAFFPPMLFPHENQILVGVLGAPFILVGFVIMLISAVPTQRSEDRYRKDDDKRG